MWTAAPPQPPSPSSNRRRARHCPGEREGYLCFTGYSSNRVINSRNAAGLRTGVFGLPANYKPAILPITPYPVGGASSAPNFDAFDSNFVYVPLSNGLVSRVAFDNGGLHPWRNQYLPGPFNSNLDASLQKHIVLTERVRLQLSMYLFNILNSRGTLTPTSEGISSLGSSCGGFGFRPRPLQVTARLKW